jgi:hypothetical protein
LRYRSLIESSDMLVKTAEEARMIVAQQLNSELADAAGYKESKSTVYLLNGWGR